MQSSEAFLRLYENLVATESAMIPYTTPNGTNISAPAPCSKAGIVIAKLTIAPKIAPLRTGCNFMPSAIPITNPINALLYTMDSNIKILNGAPVAGFSI